MSVSSSHYNADAYVTAANPAPGRQIEFEYLVRSGTGYSASIGSRSDGGIGVNVYIAGGLGPSGTVPVSQTNPTSISLSGVSISGILEVTTSAGHPVEITGSVYVLNPGGGSLSGVLTATISGAVDVNVQNWPLTQTVRLDLTGALPVSGTVGVSGTASVAVVSLPGPLEVFGAVAVSGTATVVVTAALPVSQTNLPATQSVFVVNQQSSSLSGVNVTSGALDVYVVNQGTSSFAGNVNITGVEVTLPVSMTNLPATQSVYVVNPTSGSVEISGVTAYNGALPVTGTVNVAGLAFSGTVTIPLEAYPNSLENVEFTRKKQLFDLDSDSVNYIGYAVLGTNPTSASWAIKRLTFNASGNLAATEWSSTASVWSNRASEAYN